MKLTIIYFDLITDPSNLFMEDNVRDGVATIKYHYAESHVPSSGDYYPTKESENSLFVWMLIIYMDW